MIAVWIRKNGLAFLISLLVTNASFASPSSEIARDLNKLGKTGRVLYVAAHPDDENTKVISYLSKFHNLKVGYLSLTRGSGGQNLIGDEQFPALGYIRTEELLGARKIDGGEQFFTRALDFGFSKTAEETLKIWPREDILGDVVYAIRKFRPDIIITRFAPDTEGHGHHKASAVLAREAFFKAANRDEFPEQLLDGEVDVWQAKKLYHNKPHWLKEDYSHDPSLAQMNVGGYDFLDGLSNGEIAAMSRTMHKSQGFGSKPEIGDQVEYFEPVEIVAGDRLDLLGGLDFSLDALGLDLSKLLNQIIDEFDFRSPSKSLPKLLSLRDKFSEVENIKIRNEKINYLDKIIANCLGLQVRIEATKAEYFEKEDIEISLKIFNPSDKTITLKKLVYGDKQFKLSENVKKNGILSLKKNLKSTSLTIPFWLKSPTMIGAYNIEDPQKRNLPSDDPLRSGMLAISFDSHQIMVPVEAGHYSVDPTRGEVRSYVSVLKRDYHEVMADVVLVGENGKSKDNNSTARREMGLVSLNYDHFPSSKLLVPYKAYELSLAKVENPKRVAYVQGSGDQNPEILRKMGFVVEELSKQAVLSDELELESFDVFVLGIRALNVFPEIGKLKPRLQEFMEDGGVVIVQYSTVNRISKIETEIWPYDIEIGKSRVTDEKAEPKFLVPDHPVFSSYYRIDKSDFENWVQERGLYFASSWDSHYVTPVSFADSGEDDLAGGLLVSEVGNGYFVYTGLSFFRQLPAGVSGAAKLFTNLMYLSETNSKKK